MMAPLPNPPPANDRPELPRVRLEVRTGSGRTVSYEVGSAEFLIGAASGCDLRLPVPNAPSVVCQLTRKPDGVRVRRLAAGVPVLLNGAPLPSNTATPVTNADILTLAGIEVVVAVQHAAFLSPKLIPVEAVEVPPVAPPTDDFRLLDERKRELDAEVEARREQWHEKETEFANRQRELDQQTAELEADRVMWYRRRQEIEQELTAPSPKAAELAAKEEELGRLRDELSSLREQLLAQYREKREELARDREAARDAAAKLKADRAALDEELAEHEPRLAESREQRVRLAAEYQELARQRELFAADREMLDRARETFDAEYAAETERLSVREEEVSRREADFARREEAIRADRAKCDHDRAQLHADLLRIDRQKVALADAERALDARTREVDVRLEQLKRDAAEWEVTVQQAAAEQERQRAEAERIARRQAELDEQTAKLTERAGQLEAQQAVLVVMRSKLERTREEVAREATALAAAREREEESQVELRRRIQDAERLRAELDTVQENTAQERQRLEERDSLLTAALEEIRQQKATLDAEEVRQRERQAELDVRSAEFAEQAGELKGRMTQALDLQARLEADRVAVREREKSLASAEDARQALQEQLRKRAEELASRGKALDEVARELAAERADLLQRKAAFDAERAAAEQRAAELHAGADARAADVERLGVAFAEKEQALARQVSRLKDVGAAVAAERKSLSDARAKWELDRAAALEEDRRAREELEAFRVRVSADIDTLRAQAPELEGHAADALDRLAAAKDALRGHLAELNAFARQSRDDLEAVRAQVRAESERLREQEQALDRARGEHRLAVTAFRQQLIDWQGAVAEMRRGLIQGESRIDAKQAAVEEASRHAEQTSRELAQQADQIRRERDAVVQKRTEVDKHLGDMREWYRKKLRELAGPRNLDASIRIAEIDTPPAVDDLNPGDRQLGELLKSLELVDGETLNGLFNEAKRQRRTLRAVLLASGVVTLYQLALIEAGNLDRLVLGRLRVIDRLRTTTREAIYRVFDPTRSAKADGVCLLRHLSEAEMADAVHPDEFRQRFAAARDAAHPNLADVLEVLDINGRPAVLMEWLTGLFSTDWPAHAAHPGCWVRLATMAAEAIDAAHRSGLVHGSLTPDAFVLTADGTLKITGFGEPPWLALGSTPSVDPAPAADLRALGRVVFGWSQLAAKKRGARPVKAFPAELVAVVRRLEADAESPMADTVSADRPYEAASDLVADLRRVARDTSFSDDAWAKLLQHVADNAPDGPAGLRKSA